MRRPVVAVAAAIAIAVTACSSTDSVAPATTPAPSSTTPTTTPAGADTTTTAGSTTTTTTTLAPTTTTTSTTSSTTTTTSTTVTTTTVPPPECDLDEAAAILDDTVELARLAPGGSWETGVESPAFGDRTNTADEFTYRVAYACGERFVQHTPTGAERLALVAWNDLRHAVVLQATDAPTTPYRTDAVFQLFIEQPYGEFLVDQFVWAATMAGGESIVIATRDYSAALTAKSWQAAVPRFEDLPVTLQAEQVAIDALVAVGARNVSVAEPASFGYPIGTIQFNTPLALNGFATVGPLDSFDPMVPVSQGETTSITVDGVEVRVTDGLELDFPLYETGWACGGYGWRLMASLGSPAELVEFTETLVRSLTC